VFGLKNPAVDRWKAIQNLLVVVVVRVWVMGMGDGNAKASRYHHCGR
jgi:hypothetical protein